MKCRFCVWVLFLALLGFSPMASGVEPEFRRGDASNDGAVDVSDAVVILGHLFLGWSVDCRDAADVDDSGSLTISDPINVLAYIFSGGAPPPPPGPIDCGPDPSLDPLECNFPPCGGPDPERLQAGHLLARATFGARPGDTDQLITTGFGPWIDQQILGIDESLNTELLTREAALLTTFERTRDREILVKESFFRYQKGTSPFPLDWQLPAFDDSTWEVAPAPFRLSFGRGGTLLLDMQGNYTSIACRASFFVTDPASLPTVALYCDYDDGFVAWVNGTEVGRSNLTDTFPAHDAGATSQHGPGLPEYFVIPNSLLVAGENVLAIQGHNRNLTQADFFLDPRVVVQEPTTFPPRSMMSDKESLQRFAFTRARYSENQLRNVLGMFWDNHFTTDLDKVQDVIQRSRDRYDDRVIESRQARREAAEIEREEFQFFTDSAFGDFGDLLLYSATSPSMLIYLDSILNLAAEPNENYAREILELFGLGVDNGYTQADVEEVSRCFTGWTVSKVPFESLQPFPTNAINPQVDEPNGILETPIIEIGDVWSYFKGTAEPSPGLSGEPTTAWSEIGFDDSAWLQGPTGIGFGDGDDATVLTDMQGNYGSVYLRKTFTLSEIHFPEVLELHVAYDDGVVVYLNGREVARSGSMSATGTPPAFDEFSSGHEVTRDPLIVSLDRFRGELVVGTNVLAIQVHNVNLTNGDLSCLPRLYRWSPGPGYLDVDDRQGHWIFRFDPAQHDTTEKTIFAGTPHQLTIPAGRLGVDGVLDGLDVINQIVQHPSAAEFISVKLIGLLVSDEIDLASAHDLSAPLPLRALLADAIAAWYSTNPPGNIETVVRTILNVENVGSVFRSELSRRTKVKTPFEHMLSTMRALDADFDGRSLTATLESMGMSLFDRDDPDGWPERGDRWIGTTSLLERVNFVRTVSDNVSSRFSWDPIQILNAANAQSETEIIDLFDDLLYQGTLNATERLLLQRFAQTLPNGTMAPFDPTAPDYQDRVQQLVGLMLSMPRWSFQ